MKKIIKYVLLATLSLSALEAGYTLKKKVGDVDTKLTFFGFAQLEAVGGEGFKLKSNTGSGTNANANVSFRAQRIRLGWKYIAGKVRGKVFLDFNQAHDSVDATDGAAMPKMIKDAFIAYKHSDEFTIKAGLIKQPHGMSFTIPGWNLDIAERGFDKALMLERNTGLMISGRDMFMGNNGKVNGLEMGHERPWVGFGYDLMVANQSNRNGGVAKSTMMGGNSYVARLMFDNTEKLHTEVSYAISENADGLEANATTGVSYNSMNIGIDSNLQELSLKAEYTTAENILGDEGRNETTLTATAAYFVTPSLELVGKYISGAHTTSAGVETALTNTYLGFNFFLDSPKKDFSRKSKRGRNQHKVLFNYIVSDYDTANAWGGLKGYKANAWIAQYQFKF